MTFIWCPSAVLAHVGASASPCCCSQIGWALSESHEPVPPDCAVAVGGHSFLILMPIHLSCRAHCQHCIECEYRINLLVSKLHFPSARSMPNCLLMLVYKRCFMTIKAPVPLIEPHGWFVFGTAFLSVCHVGCLICPQYIEIVALIGFSLLVLFTRAARGTLLLIPILKGLVSSTMHSPITHCFLLN